MTGVKKRSKPRFGTSLSKGVKKGYLVVRNEEISWLDAQKKCQSQGADLINLPEGDVNFYNFWIPFVSSMGLIGLDGTFDRTLVGFFDSKIIVIM